MNKDDFVDFESSRPGTPSAALTERVLSAVRADMNPSIAQVFSKLALIHLATAIVTLSLCPQFGFRLLGDGMGLMATFMAFGHLGCMAACGVFFVGTSLAVASIALRPEEIRRLRKNRSAALGALILLSLGFFLMIDAESVLAGFALAWIFGSFVGGILSLELGWLLRRRALMQGANG